MGRWRRRRIRIRLVKRDGCCFYCGRELEVWNSTLDHVEPRSQGGTDRRENLVLACHRCNKRKADYPLEVIACGLQRGRAIYRPKFFPKK